MKLLDSKWALAGLCAVVGLLGTTASASVVARNVVVKVMERTGDKLFEKALEYPATLDTVPKIKATTPLIITFDSQTVNDTSLALDQALVSFQHVDTKNEVALPARAVKSTDSYKMDVSRKNFRLHFSSAPGVYNVALVLGSFKQGGLFYDLGNVEMVAPKSTKAKKPVAVYGPKPEIHHRFAEPQKMPNILVSLFFTGLVVVPFIGLLAGWAHLGVNADKLQMEPIGSVIFMGLIAAYITLAISYWIGVKLFPTLTYALVLALPTYLIGQYALSKRIEKHI